jgi:hypothetical protein
MPRRSNAFLKRSAAAKRGWATRRRHERAARRQRAQRAQRPQRLIQHLVTVTVKTRRNGRVRQFSRDLLIPAPKGTSVRGLFAIAENTVKAKERYAVDWYHTKGRKITVAEGPPTRAKKAKLR